LTGGRPFGAVRIAVGKVAAAYYVHELTAADGRGFEVEKIDPTVPAGERVAYHVFLEANGQDRSCDCLGFSHHGHCKHADGLGALFGHGR
jgi:hypothetical protein